jgi:HlyD family secretion protein
MRTIALHIQGPRAPRAAIMLAIVLATLGACRGTPEPDASGTFEATEVVVSSQTAGPVQRFTPVEGMRLDSGQVVALVDTASLALEGAQLTAQRAAVGARGTEVGEQLRVLDVQRDIARRAWERTQRLHTAQAATAQQLDQAERDYRVLGAQIMALRAQRRSVGRDVSATEARVAQVRDRVSRSTVLNPVTGTVLATYARAGEVVQAGQPLYKVADLDTLVLRAYVGEAQLASFRLGQRVAVRVDHGQGRLLTVPGTVTWVSPKAEFTPTPVQTRDERSDLVYAVKVRVANPDGALKIGMPGDVTLAQVVATGTSGARP